MQIKQKKKAKLLYLMDILERKTDEEHSLCANDLCECLEKYNISAERKSVYSDIETLREFGMDIVKTHTPSRGYFLASRLFELAEIRLLIDAVQAAYFIPQKKTRSLIKKISSLVSDSQMEMLNKQVYVDSRIKTKNEQIYYSIDIIHKAIIANKQIKFLYHKKRVLDHYSVSTDEKEFVVNPYALIWSNDHYYLVCNKINYNNLIHIRLDRIKKVALLDSKARHFSQVSNYKNSFNQADYASKLFNMFSGSIEPLELICSDSILKEINERFGDAVPCRRYDDKHFIIRTDAVISEGLVSWIMQYGSNIRVSEPENLRQSVINRAKETIKSNERS